MKSKGHTPTNTKDGLWKSLKRIRGKNVSSTKRQTDFTDSAGKASSGKVMGSVSAMWRNIDEMPMEAFVSAYCDGLLESLYKCEVPETRDEDVERKHLERLYGEYVERIIDGSGDVFRSSKAMLLAYSKLKVLEAMRVFVSVGNIPKEIARILRSHNVFLTPNLKRNTAILEAAIDTAARKFITAYEKQRNEKKNDQVQDRKYFVELLASLSTHFKFSITLTNTTVGSFCSYMLLMKKEVTALNNANSKNKWQKQ